MTVSLPPQSEHHVPTLQPTGWLRYFSFSVDHKVIGLQYLVCGFSFMQPRTGLDKCKRHAAAAHARGFYVIRRVACGLSAFKFG